MADSYVCSGAMMKCTMGTSPATLTVLPDRMVFLAGQLMANIGDNKPMANLAPFGLCRSLGFPATASATAAALGTLTPMPCMHNTPAPWIGGKTDYLIKGQPALLKSCTCQCMWGGTISLINNGQVGEGAQGVNSSKHNQQIQPLEIDVPPLLIEPKKYKTIPSSEFKPLDEAQTHLSTLKALFVFKDPDRVFKNVPDSWKASINNAIKKINNNKDKGIASVYSDVEHLYNMYKLATSKDAKKYGLDKLSDKTPYLVFELAKKVPGFIDNMPPKKFWDSFDKFVPLYTHVGTGAYYSPSYGYVVIPRTKDSLKRMKKSKWYQAGRLYHEFGHAFDYQKGWRKDPEFVKLYLDFQKEMQDSNITQKLKEYIRKKGGTWRLSNDELEKLMSLSDSLQAATPGHEVIPPGGHSEEYFSTLDAQMAELIAHMSENYWSGNDLYELLAPETYKKMRELLEKRWK